LVCCCSSGHVKHAGGNTDLKIREGGYRVQPSAVVSGSVSLIVFVLFAAGIFTSDLVSVLDLATLRFAAGFSSTDPSESLSLTGARFLGAMMSGVCMKALTERQIGA